jgi:hypothetical protein
MSVAVLKSSRQISGKSFSTKTPYRAARRSFLIAVGFAAQGLLNPASADPCDAERKQMTTAGQALAKAKKNAEELCKKIDTARTNDEKKTAWSHCSAAVQSLAGLEQKVSEAEVALVRCVKINY